MWCLKNFPSIVVVVVVVAIVLCDIPFVTSLSTSSSDEKLVELNQPDAAYQLRLLPSKLISPVQALKLNRYQSPRTAAKKLKIQVPIINSKHKLKYHGQAMDISQIQPEIEVPSSRTTPLSLIFKFSSSPLNIEQRHLQQSQNLLLLDSHGINDLRKTKFPMHYSAYGMPLIQSDPKILQTYGNRYRYGYHQQPRYETIEQMIGEQDLSYLYEPLLLNSLAEKLSTQESTIATLYAVNNNNNNHNTNDNNPEKLSSTTISSNELPITLTNTYSHSNNNFDQQLLLNYLSRMATTVKPQQQQNYLIDPTTPQIIPSMDLTIFHFKNDDNPIINQLSANTATIKK